MISFSIDKQSGKVDAEGMSRPVDSIKKSKNNQPLALVLTSMEQSPTFASRLKRKLLSGPIFGGAYNYTIDNDQFNANWKILHYNRPIDQHWTEENLKLTGSEFGLKLLLPVDQYQKSIRTSKYSHLLILLTFIALFLVEITQKIRIHPFQYILIGAALIIYYTLLLSLSEQLGYNLAYLISALATVLLICVYSFSFLRNHKLVWLLTALLTLFYSFIFIIIIQQDFSLLIGSIGLFIMIAALMYFSRKVDWYKPT